MSDSTPGEARAWSGPNLLEFIETLSGELRVPLTPILSVPDLMLKDSQGQLSADQRELLEVLRLNGRRLMRMVEDLTAIGQIVQLKSALGPDRFEQVDVCAALSRVAERMRPELEHAGMAVTTELDPKLPAVEATSEAVDAIVSSLLANAITNNRAHGQIWLRALRADEQQVEIQIEDTGFGVSPELQSKLASPVLPAANPLWYWVASPGLYIIKSFIDLLHGELEVRSQLDVGSLFSVRLPIRQPSAR
jgi:signal transduction histidine kinase